MTRRLLACYRQATRRRSSNEGTETLLRKKSITLSGHQTSVALEAEFWIVLEDLAVDRGVSIAQLIRDIDEARGRQPLASACRLLALAWAQQRSVGAG